MSVLPLTSTAITKLIRVCSCLQLESMKPKVARSWPPWSCRPQMSWPGPAKMRSYRYLAGQGAGLVHVLDREAALRPSMADPLFGVGRNQRGAERSGSPSRILRCPVLGHIDRCLISICRSRSPPTSGSPFSIEDSPFSAF